MRPPSRACRAASRSVERPPDVDLDLLGEVLARHLGDQRHSHEPGRAHSDVDTTELRLGLVNSADTCSGSAMSARTATALPPASPTAVTTSRALRRRRVADRDRYAVASQPLRAAPDPARPPVTTATFDRVMDPSPATRRPGSTRELWNQLCSRRFVDDTCRPLILGPVGVGKPTSRRPSATPRSDAAISSCSAAPTSSSAALKPPGSTTTPGPATAGAAPPVRAGQMPPWGRTSSSVPSSGAASTRTVSSPALT